MKKKKILFAASSGGHLEEILCLQPLNEDNYSILVTEKTAYDIYPWQNKVYKAPQVNRREKSLPFKMLWISLKSMYILFREKPDVVVSTGVLAMLPVCLLAKLFRRKLIYIESFAKVNSLTMSGKLIYKFADLFIVQWPELKKLYPKAVLGGGIF